MALVAGCSDGPSIGLVLVSQNAGSEGVELEFGVTREAYFAVVVEGVRRASGWTEEGSRRVTLSPAFFGRCRNAVRIEVASAEGATSVVETRIDYCGAEDCTPCDGWREEPDGGADSGPVQPDSGPGLWEHLCEPCQDHDDCGGSPFRCYRINYGSPVCLPDCEQTTPCPELFDCYSFSDEWEQWNACMPTPQGAQCPYSIY